MPELDEDFFTSKAPSARKPVVFRDVAVERELRARSGDRSLGVTASRDLARYYRALRLAVPAFSYAEAVAVYAALAGWEAGEDGLSFLFARVYDYQAQQGTLDMELVERLRRLPPIAGLALLDACERATLMTAQGDPVEGALVAVGLLPAPLAPAPQRATRARKAPADQGERPSPPAPGAPAKP